MSSEPENAIKFSNKCQKFSINSHNTIILNSIGYVPHFLIHLEWSFWNEVSNKEVSRQNPFVNWLADRACWLRLGLWLKVQYCSIEYK